ncbi:MAG: ABC transporter ATP-binding protein [Chloroflexota bacterium]
MQAASAIQVQNVYKHYGNIPALDGLSLSVNRGEIFGLLGANGAGKTTLINVLIGAVKRDGGAVTVLDMDPASQRHAIRRSVGYMPQAAALYEDLSARDNVRFFARARAVPDLDLRLDEVMDFVELTDRQHDPVFGFSGGMKQRVSLACALVHKPSLLLLDEPSTGVDPKLRESFWGHFHALAEQGATILISTHQMDEALHCDRTAVMRGGRVLACDTPRGLLGRGRATITIWQNGATRQQTIDAYPEQLPRLLGLPENVHRVEVREDTLEDVVLRLIEDEAHSCSR